MLGELPRGMRLRLVYESFFRLFGFSFSDEIYAYVDIDASEEVVGRELFTPVVVGVQDCTCAGIPSGVVPNDSESSDSVEA